MDIFGPTIPACNDPIESLPDYGVMGRLHESRKPRTFLLGSLAFGDVANNGEHKGSAVTGILYQIYRAQRQLDPDLLTTLLYGRQLQRSFGCDVGAAARIGVARDTFSVLGLERLGDQRLDLKSDSLRRCVAKDSLGHRITQHYPLGLSVSDDDRIANFHEYAAYAQILRKHMPNLLLRFRSCCHSLITAQERSGSAFAASLLVHLRRLLAALSPGYCCHPA